MLGDGQCAGVRWGSVPTRLLSETRAEGASAAGKGVPSGEEGPLAGHTLATRNLLRCDSFHPLKPVPQPNQPERSGRERWKSLEGVRLLCVQLCGELSPGGGKELAWEPVVAGDPESVFTGGQPEPSPSASCQTLSPRARRGRAIPSSRRLLIAVALELLPPQSPLSA